METGKMLRVEDVHTYYGDSYVLQGVSLDVENGKVVSVLGRNGVGKTTLIRTVIGFTPSRRGRVLVDGADVTARRAHRIARLGVGIVPQGRRIFPSLTVRENLEIVRRGRAGRGVWDMAGVLEVFPRLKERLSNRGGTLSGGEQQMLAVCRALLGNPKLLLMDEPSEGLSPPLVEELGRLIKRLKKTEIAILLVEQNLEFAAEVADSAYVMDKGRFVFQSHPRELMNNEEIKARFLGV